MMAETIFAEYPLNGHIARISTCETIELSSATEAGEHERKSLAGYAPAGGDLSVLPRHASAVARSAAL
jgi:hypothetical protein